jgi:hypothetical protein
MTESAKRGGARKGAGRPTKDAAGERMENHSMRWTEPGWADVLYIGADRVRELVARDAAKKRKDQK